MLNIAIKEYNQFLIFKHKRLSSIDKYTEASKDRKNWTKVWFPKTPIKCDAIFIRNYSDIRVKFLLLLYWYDYCITVNIIIIE